MSPHSLTLPPWILAGWLMFRRTLRWAQYSLCLAPLYNRHTEKKTMTDCSGVRGRTFSVRAEL